MRPRQNGEITSGVHTTNPRFYQPAYQQRSRDTMDAVLKYVSTHKYGSVVSAVAPINEVSHSLTRVGPVD